MIIAIDNIDLIEKVKGNDIVYVFDKFNAEDIKKAYESGAKCINYKYVKKVDINLTGFDIKCKKKANINDEDALCLPPRKDYKFAIIVPNYNNDHGNYNGKTFFQNCIESVLNQTYKNFELIIVDDMSTDTSVETVDNYVDNRIHLIKNKRKRYNGGSRNVGIEYALDNLEFDYFCFLDSDDWWKHNRVLEEINYELNDCDMALIGMELIDKNGVFMTKFHSYKNADEFFLSDNKVWCTAWSRVIRKDKIVYFCEDTLMEDRVWSYLQADNVDYNNVINIEEVMYVWNRTNTSNSVSLSRSNMWNASAYCHIGHQLMLKDKLKHKEYIKLIEPRIEKCKSLVKSGEYKQY